MMVQADFISGEAPPKRQPRIRRGGWSWGPVEGVRGRFLSLGAGVQTTALALMASHGEIDGPLPDAAIYAPSGDSRTTLEHLGWLQSGNVLPFPVHVLDSPPTTLRRAIQNRVEQTGRYVSIPAYLDGKKSGQDRRQCTREYKVDRIKAALRRLVGAKPGQVLPPLSVEVWIGYTTDEVVRAGAAFDRWAVHRFPLLEKRMSLADCISWLEKHDYPVPPRSKCTWCPYRTNSEWQWLKENEPEAWEDAIEIDSMIRNTPGMRASSFLHKSHKPLSEIDLTTAEERGQGDLLLVCEAGCGL